MESKWQIPKNFDEQKYEQKIIQFFQERLKIYLPKKILQECSTPIAFIDYIGFTNYMIKLKDTEENEEHVATNPLLYRMSTALYMHVFYFIMNRVPSDLYRFKNPKFTLKTIEVAQKLEQQKEILPKPEQTPKVEEKKDDKKVGISSRMSYFVGKRPVTSTQQLDDEDEIDEDQFNEEFD